MKRRLTSCIFTPLPLGGSKGACPLGRSLLVALAVCIALTLAAPAFAAAENKDAVAVIIGNDQRELFTEDNSPAFLVYWGDTIENRPRTEAQRALLPPGVAVAERGHAPPEDAVYPGQPELGRHIIERLVAEVMPALAG